MNWKKNVFSYLMWLLYTVVVGSSLFCVIALLVIETGYSLPVYLLGGCACLIATGGLVFLLHFLWQKISKFTFERKKIIFLLEGIIVVALLVAGVMQGISNFPRVYEGESYFELVKITDGQGVIQVVHGATYFFLQFLHVICLFFGNKITICIAAQMILYAITAVILYFAVRRIAGVLPAIATFAFMVLSPSLNQNAKSLSPNVLFLFFYVIALHLIAVCLKNNYGSVFKYIITGIAIAFVTYLDVMGVTLLLFVVSILYAKRQNAEKLWNKPIVVVPVCLVTSVAGFFGCIALDALFSGDGFLRVLNAWGNLYYPKGYHLEIALFEHGYAGDRITLLSLLILGIFSFLCRKKVERLSIWVLTAAVLALMECFGIIMPEMNVAFYFYICLSVMSGIGIANIFIAEDEEPCEEEEELMQENETVVNEKVEEPAVQFIENPLPLPKKHVSKIMDYDYEVADDDDFDIQ